MSKKTYPLQQVLELACAAQRFNGSYVKEGELLYSSDGQAMANVHPNKTLMKVAIGEQEVHPNDPNKPKLITTNLEDRDLATEIQKFYRKLAFAAIVGENEFHTKVNMLLNSTEINASDFGFIACLPSVYYRDYANQRVEKYSKSVDAGYLAPVGTIVLDKDVEILESKRSQNYEAWNICAIIDNKMVSWFSKKDLKLGACVLVKGNVKDHSTHWKYKNAITRLNYVKAAQ